MKTFFEIKRYADYDIPITDCIMWHENYISKEKILKEFCEYKGLESLNKLNYYELNDITDDLIYFLELKGFEQLKTTQILFTD